MEIHEVELLSKVIKERNELQKRLKAAERLAEAAKRTLESEVIKSVPFEVYSEALYYLDYALVEWERTNAKE